MQGGDGTSTVNKIQRTLTYTQTARTRVNQEDMYRGGSGRSGYPWRNQPRRMSPFSSSVGRDFVGQGPSAACYEAEGSPQTLFTVSHFTSATYIRSHCTISLLIW